MEPVLILIYTSIYIGLFATSFYALSYFSTRKKEKPLFKDHELPSVSVLIPTYNEEKSIKRTIESILTSDYPQNKFEIIIIDNNSEDNTVKIIKDLQKTHKKQLFISNCIL